MVHETVEEEDELGSAHPVFDSVHIFRQLLGGQAPFILLLHHLCVGNQVIVRGPCLGITRSVLLLLAVRVVWLVLFSPCNLFPLLPVRGSPSSG